jgi:single-strand DNA-binding protein
MIKLQAIGTLGKDAEQKQVNGKGLISFSFAVDQGYKNKAGEKVEKTTWIDAAVWTDSAGLLNVLKKGAKVYVEGEPSARGYASKDGEVVGALSIKVNSLEVVKYVDSEAKQPVSAGAAQADDDLPF